MRLRSIPSPPRPGGAPTRYFIILTAIASLTACTAHKHHAAAPRGAKAATLIQRQLQAEANQDGQAAGFGPITVTCSAVGQTHVVCDESATDLLQSDRLEYDLVGEKWKKGWETHGGEKLNLGP